MLFGNIFGDPPCAEEFRCDGLLNRLLRRHSVVRGYDGQCESKCVTARGSTGAFAEGWVCGTCPRVCVPDRDALLDAVDDYLNDNSIASSASQLYGYPINNWCVDNIEDFSDLFSSSRNGLAADFNEDINDWNVQQATTLIGMFSEAAKFNQPLLDWDVSSVTDMTSMFFGASSFDQPIGTWDTRRVEAMGGMFSEATSFNQDIGDWDVSSSTTFLALFNGATSFNQDLSSWNTSRVKFMINTFAGATSFDQDVSAWDIGNVDLMSGMFEGAENFSQNLCAWGEKFRSSAVIVTDMFTSTNCNVKTNPILIDDPVSPLCFDCSLS